MKIPDIRDLLNIVENKQLDEAGAGPSRIVKHVKDGAVFFMISAMRGDKDRATNMRRSELLASKLASLPVTFIRTTGEYQEDGQDQPSRELSFFVMPRGQANVSSFIGFGSKLMGVFEQDSILVGNGENVALLFADGSTHPLGTAATFSPAVLAHLGGFSMIKGRKFSFTQPDDAPLGVRYGEDKPTVNKTPG